MIGRRRPDLREDRLHEDILPGDYWRVLDRETGEPLNIECPSNLTGGAWRVACPSPAGGWLLANLQLHTVREHEDGTISVRPNDGSSNSILVTGRPEEQWHGYIEHGEFRPC